MVEDLIAGFDEELFCDFVNSKFSGSFSRSEREIPEIDDFPWETARQLGIVKRLQGPNNSNMPLLIVAAKFQDGEELKERSSRIRQFRFAKQILDDAMSNPAPGVDGVIAQGLFVFYDESGNFRLSLVYGKAEGTKLSWSTAKRFSFHVEAGQANKTFRDRLELDWSSFDKLKDAFSVEKLTKEFYTRLFAWYQRAMESDEVIFPNDIVKDKEPGEVKSEQIIRLITRLMFVWFLKQKHLVPSDLFDPERMSDILKKFDPESGENYYRAILQNLFFATLNTEIGDRAFAVEGNREENEEHFGVKIFYRYASEFAVSEKEVIKLFGSIPFMNGGLFECLDRDNHYYDGFSRRKSKRAQVPNALFFDDKGLIPLLSQYNFTVEENSPGDEEVALDPEMLGKVFENLLGAYNPETQVAARNATGSFYTPREIVNYMVDESLKAHVKTKVGCMSNTGIPACDALSETTQARMPELPSGQAGMPVLHSEWDAAVNTLFADGIRPADEELCRKIEDALVSAKILDPACGSGAFPMGILLRMVELLRILRKIPEDENVYDLKLELIENCIYGVDIQCIAVQISKLRFFISLVCEEGAVLNQSSTGIPACAEAEKAQTGMSVLRSRDAQAGMPELPSLSISHRKLPHWKKDGAIYWITFRLADSIPQSKLKAWKESYDLWFLKNPKPWDDLQWQQYNEHFGRPLEKWLDAGMGSCSLARSDVRDALIDCMLKFDGGRLALHSAVMMPNHVHCLMELGPGEDLSAILKGIKGASARAANQILGTSGKFWMDESYDHIVRSEEQYAHFRRYIRANPQKAGLNENQYWLYEGNTGIPACGKEGSTGIPACDEEAQTGMSVLPCAENNYGIHTLPNLETKFVAANSLVALSRPKERNIKGQFQSEMFSEDEDPEIKRQKDELWKLRHQHFMAKSYQDKKMLRRKDRLLRERLAETIMEKKHYSVQTAKNMADWDPYDQNKSAKWFGPEWMFNVSNGFDVVIGNPPYVNLANIKPDSTRENLKSLYYSARNKSDLYAFFIERGFSLLNINGLMAYIVPHTWKATDSFKNLREIIFTKHTLLKVVNLEMGVFDAVVKPLIAIFSSERLDVDVDIHNKIFERVDSIPYKDILQHRDYVLDTTSTAQMRQLYAKIEQNSIALKDIVKFSRGIKTSNDARFIHTSKKGNDYCKVFRGRNIKAYSLNWAGEYIWYRPDLMREKVGCVPYSREMFVVPEKIVTQRVNSSFQLLVAYDDEQRFFLDTANVSRVETLKKEVSLKYVCGLLNSRLINFWYCNKYRMPTIGLYELHSIPIKISGTPKKFICLVDRILTSKKSDPDADTSVLEDEIDQLVYKLYDLTPEEIAIVEGSTGIPACAKAEKAQTGMSVLRSKKKRNKAELPPSLPGWD